MKREAEERSMADKGDLEALYLALNDAPGDAATVLALADWYADNDEPDSAECLRWLHEQRRWPFRYTRDAGLAVERKAWHEGWFWWTAGGIDEGWGYPPECVLPATLWASLPHSFGDITPRVFKEYSSARGAYEALLQAWPAFQRRRRERRGGRP
jgi:hypothetical protein